MTSKISVKRDLDKLRKRANQRITTLSMNPKTEKETAIEKDFFRTVENQIYAQIARDWLSECRPKTHLDDKAN